MYIYNKINTFINHGKGDYQFGPGFPRINLHERRRVENSFITEGLTSPTTLYALSGI